VAGAVLAASTQAGASFSEIDTVTLSGPFFNVKDYGAKGDAYPNNANPTDDTCAVNLAIQAALKSYVGTPGGQLRTGGGIVLFPAGRYYIAGTIYVSRGTASPCTPSDQCGECDPVHQGITLMGAGPLATTLIVPSAHSGSTITIAPNGPIDLQGCAIQDLGIECLTQRTSGIAIAVNSQGHRISNVFFRKQFLGCRIGDTQSSASAANILVDNCQITNVSAGGVGISVDGANTGEIHLRDLIITGVNAAPANQAFAGIRLLRGGGFWISNCDVIQFRLGLLIDPQDHVAPDINGVVQFAFFTGCAFDNCGIHCMLIQPPGAGVAKGLFFSNCWSATPATGHCCHVGGGVNGCEFVGHRFLNAPLGDGLNVSAPATNVNADACTASGQPNGSGFAFSGNVINFAVRNCRSGPYGGPGFATFAPSIHGVLISAGCSNYIVTNNMLSGNTSTGLADSGVAPKITTPNLV
jgi:hypothetical protein